LVVSIHAPARGATAARRRLRRRLHRFNPRAREGRDQIQSARQQRHLVSIHAPARGATVAYEAINARYLVSIHAPARGATLEEEEPEHADDCFNPRAREGRDPGWWFDPTVPPCFNPRAREGRDQWRAAGGVAGFAVSIHAPARGATQPSGEGRLNH